VHYNVGSAYESLGRTEQARLEYRKALEVDPGFADAQARLSEMRKATPAPKQSSAPAQAPGASADVPLDQ
jgi:tetratricopeptide (TPR) repeat protein